MNVSLVVPVPQEGMERIRNWQWLRERYARAFPDWDLVESTLNPSPWSKGAVVNAGVARATGDVLVLADADVLIAPGALLAALAALRDGAAWVCPHGRVRRLGEESTRALVNGRLRLETASATEIGWERPVRRGSPGGGIVIVRAEDFRKVGGMDPRFTVWGGEDDAFGRALDTLVGRHVRLNATAWHLWHPTLRPDNGRASAENEALAARYLEANGDRVAMAELYAKEDAV